MVGTIPSTISSGHLETSRLVLYELNHLVTSGGQGDRRTEGHEERRTGGLEDMRTGRKEDREIGRQEDMRTGEQ